MNQNEAAMQKNDHADRPVDGGDVAGGLDHGAAHEDANLMPPIIDAAKAYVTMGEMCDALRQVWGVWRETPVF